MTPILVFDELDSTNAEARRRAEAGERGPAWIMARRQTAGRGRRGRAWESGEGNLAATLLLSTGMERGEGAQLAFVAALAADAMIRRYVPDTLVGLKWPNDVLVDGRKACGMLIEAGEGWSAVGVGVNLASHPEAVERPATHLGAHLRPDLAEAPEPEAALETLAEAFDETLDLWRREGFAPIRAAWTARALGIGGPCAARLARETISGIAEGLDEDGALLLRLPHGGLRRITAGDVFLDSTTAPGPP